MENIEKIKELVELLENAIDNDAPILLTWGNIIKDGYDNEIDSIRGITRNSREWLAEYQTQLIQQTGISTLKIKYTNVTGYFIEIPKSQVEKVPANFTIKQTLVWWARYVTTELSEFEKKLVQWEMLLAQREYEIFLEVREKILWNFKQIKEFSNQIGYVDFICGLSTVAITNNYIKPEIHTGVELKIVAWRHPIVETIERDFISNDIDIWANDYIHTITWPNMWGKSTFLRQNALIILMAHVWSFVPAKSAKIPLTDKVFSRVWAADNLVMWQSTFMVEMQETAYILNNATHKSFIIIDEVWRWTSTYDGMSLAWAILKHIHDNIKAKTLFATHYHELVDEAQSLSQVRNFSVAVWENNENIVFLRKIIPGAMKKSYGIDVAKIAWISNDVLVEAKKMLKKLELEHKKTSQIQLNLWDFREIEVVYKEKKSQVEEELRTVDENTLTPLEALNLVASLKKKL